MSPARRLVVVAPNWLGDAVMALPLLADIRRAWPETAVSVAARSSVAGLFALIPGIDVMTLHGGGGWRSFTGWRRDAHDIAAGRFDAALLLPNSFGSAWIVSRAGVPERWGYAADWRTRLLTRALSRPRARVHQAQYYSEIGAQLGVTSGPLYAAVPVREAAMSAARSVLETNGCAGDRPFVAMAPGAAYGRAKQWLPERFAELASLLASERGIATVLIGTKQDAAVCRSIATMPGLKPGPSERGIEGGGIIDLSGKTTLDALTGILALSAATVANDSGAMHLAAAVGSKVVAVFGPTDDTRTHPLRAHDRAPEPVVIRHDVWCRPCMLRECPIDHRCMRGISARTVMEALGL